MRILTIFVAAVVAFPTVAFAQSPRDDIAYCEALASLYVHFIGRSATSPYDDVRRGSLAGQVAASQCVPGRTAEAIPVLEQQLRNNKLTLPPRG